jgi:hypothetical protein
MFLYMGNLSTKKKTHLLSILVVFISLTVLLIKVDQIYPAPHLDDLGAGSFQDSILAIVLSGLVLYIAAGFGSLLIKPFKLDKWTFIERTVIALPIGLAAIAYGVFVIGLAGWIKPIHIIFWLIILSVISLKQSSIYFVEAVEEIIGFKNTWSSFSLIKRVVFSAGVLALLLALFQAFTPPWDYDGLAYHLQGPRLFLEVGRIIPIPENWFSYYPSTWEMLYMLGMGLGSDIFARLIHFSTLILFLLATYAFGRRFLPKSGGWLAAAILVGIPILPLWGNAAYTDIAWALFQFLAIALFLVWIKERNPWLLGLSGVIQGLALGSKYLALTGAGILLVFVLWYSLRDEGKWTGWKTAIRNGMIFGLATLIVALPWYLKNYIWTGNPVFPLYFPQHVIDPTQLQVWMDYVNSFGTGKNWYDYLLLPFNLYLQHDKFGTFMGSMEMPSPLFLFALAYPWLRKSIDTEARKTLDGLGFILISQFIFWAVGSHQNRFLLPLFPGLSILASGVFILLAERFTKYRLGNAIKVGTVSGMVFVTLIFMGIYVGLIRPDRVLLGIDSKQDFLIRVLRDYPGISFVNNNLPKAAVPIFLWDGRGYYCKNKCLADVDQSRWSALIQNTSSLEKISIWLQKSNITHVFFSKEDITYFLLKHDQQKIHLQATKFLLEKFVPDCTNIIFEDEWSVVYQINATCK